ncbi:tol-pal system protein YbgF [Vibrio sp. HA2012]|uniref:tol-pal system protein YbgF n=1 Tax=Vibrio sp. HA2012 TaxID=1971595 RepID=UPI000C2BE6C7|nr:tol-pal system protein YbgF [Vibrio sp. HA2012]PJC87697.1 tol-pal system protein YbgF [Vibrio sp. HA2012]
MFSNFKRAVSLTLLAGVAGSSFAAPAPVSDINSTSSSAVSASQTQTPETEIQRLERLLNNRSRVQVQMQQQLDTMAAEIQTLRGIVERNQYDMNQMLERQKELFIELDRVRGEVKNSPQPVSSDVVQAADSSDVPAASGTYTANADEETAYKAAVDLILKKKDYAGAISAFKKFQADFPESNFAPNAHYWLGQLYFAQKQDVEAAKSFASVVAYKDSNKRADSLVKLGDIAKRNNKPEVAKKYYQQVISEYPDSASAKTAQQHL